MVRTVAALICAGLLTASAAGAAYGAKPVRQACVGETFSGASGHPLGREVVRGFAREPGPFGQGIQALQAGEIGDDVAENTCNDDGS